MFENDQMDTLYLHWHLTRLYRSLWRQYKAYRKSAYFYNRNLEADYTIELEERPFFRTCFFAYHGNETNEVEYFNKLERKINYINTIWALLCTFEEEESIQRELLKHYFPKLKVGFCIMNHKSIKKEDYLNSKIILKDQTLSLDELTQKIPYHQKPEPKVEEPEPAEKGFIQLLKESLS